MTRANFREIKMVKEKRKKNDGKQLMFVKYVIQKKKKKLKKAKKSIEII